MGALTTALLLVALSPLLVVETPAMVDYVNHLARMELLAAGGPHPAYEVVWRLYPNLAMDLVVPALAQVVPVAIAGKLFLALSQLLMVGGAAAIEWAVKRQHGLSGLGALLVLYSLPFAWGLMNFMFGLGIALWGVALWIGLRDRNGWLRWAVHALVVVMIFLAHFFALGIYGLSIGLIELSRLAGRPLDLKRLVGLAAFMASPVVMLLAAMGSTGGAIGGDTIDWDFGLKLLWPLSFLNIYDAGLAMLTLAALVALLATLTLTGRLTLSPAGVWVAAGLAALYLALPRRLFDVAYVDVRLIAAAALILPAFMSLRPLAGPWRHVPLIVAVGIILANDAGVARAWLDHRQDFQEIRASFSHLRPDTAVLIGRQDGAAGESADVRPLYYAPTLAAPAAKVFVSSLYSLRGMQPVQTTPAYRELEILEALDNVPVPAATLRRALTPAAEVTPHVRRWPERYQYLYLMGAPQPNPAPGRLIELDRGRKFILYRVVNAAGR